MQNLCKLISCTKARLSIYDPYTPLFEMHTIKVKYKMVMLHVVPSTGLRLHGNVARGPKYWPEATRSCCTWFQVLA